MLDPCAHGVAFRSPSSKTPPGCPFRYFLKRGLGIRPVDDSERDRDVWLDPLTRGSELHDLYARMLRRCRDEKRRPERQTTAPGCAASREERLAALAAGDAAGVAGVRERESQQFLADVELFLEAEECEASTATPIGFEVSFGRPLDDDAEPLARAEPVDVDLGGGLTFRIAGRIDRIDQVGPDAFEMLDYKTGGFWREDWKGTFAGGRRLQHALYGLAAVELLRAQAQEADGRRGRVLLPEPQGQPGARADPGAGRAAIARCSATCAR